RFGEHRCRKDAPRSDTREPFALLRVRAPAEDQFGSDLRARTERANADIATRQFLGDDAHRLLAEAHAGIFLRNGQSEHTELGHLRDDLERDIAVGAVPTL